MSFNNIIILSGILSCFVSNSASYLWLYQAELFTTSIRIFYTTYRILENVENTGTATPLPKMNIGKWCSNAENMRKLSSGNGSSSAGSWRSQDSSAYTSKEVSTRPPVYNPEDYAASLKKWANKSIQKPGDLHDSIVLSPSGESEMSLRQFLNISDLLSKLKTDLKLSYLSFVQEFVADPVDGITLLLELLRSIQLNDAQQQGKVASTTHRRSLLDENSCLQCLQYCMRCEETARRLAVCSAGLFTLAVCIMSSVSKSRIISLELLSKVCCYSSTSGHNAVSEAMSTMRLRFGEPVRFRFLVSMLNGAAPDLLIAGLRFINTFLETAPSKQMQLYIQAELEQAGFSSETFKKMLSSKERQDESFLDEYNRWSKLYIDVEILKNNYNLKCKEVTVLKEKMTQLESQIRVLQNEKITQSTLRENTYNERFSDLDYHISIPRSSSVEKSYALNNHNDSTKKEGGGNSTQAEDEGISSSDQDDIEEITSHSREYSHLYAGNNATLHNGLSYQDKHAEPTIDEVMEDFQNIINDVQNQNYRNEQKNDKYVIRQLQNLNICNSNESLSEALILDKETDIVPTKILPEPPKKARSLHLLNKNIEMNPFFEDESVIDNSNFSCFSQCNIQSSSDQSPAFTYSYENGMDDVKLAQKPVIRSQKPNLRRSETFHHLQGSKSQSNPAALDLSLANKARRCLNDRIRVLNTKNKNYIIQNSNNFQKEIGLKGREEGIVKLSRSVSTKPLNSFRTLKCAPFPALNPISYFSKTNLFPGNSHQFSLKRHNNAGLYSDKDHIQSSNNHLHQVITIAAEYPKRSLNGLKQLNLNVCDGKIMDLPSGLY